MRKRKTDKHLPRCVYLKHGAYWLVKGGKWTRLSESLPDALAQYARILESDGREMMPDLIDRLHAEVIRGKAKNTILQYDRNKQTCQQILEHFAPAQVTPADIAQIKLHYADRPNMGNRILSYLRMIFDRAVELQIVTANPCIGIKRHAEVARTRYLSDHEFNAIKEHASDDLRVILDIAYLTSQRIGDILNIKHSDITDQGIYFEQQKTKNRLLVELTPDLKQALTNAQSRPRHHQSDYLFTTIRGQGNPYSYGTVRDMYRLAAKKAGITDTGLHDIRAKSLTDADAEGLNATHLAGHSSTRQTERYLRQRRTKTATPPKLR